MRKSVMVSAVTVGLLGIGMGVADAANSGSFTLSNSSAYVSGGAYNFYAYQVRPGIYYPGVSGTYVVNTATDHLNAKPDGYSYAKLVQANSVGSYSFNNYLTQGGTGGVTVASGITVQTCREHYYGDDCTSKIIYR